MLNSRERQCKLTSRQIEVLRASIEVEGKKVVGRKLNLATGTIRAHIDEAKRKLGTSGRFQTIIKAAENKFLDLRESFLQEKVELLQALSPAQFNALKESVGKDGRLKTAREVAQNFQKSVHTLKKQREGIRKKMGVGIALAGLVLVVALASGFEYRRKRRSRPTQTF